MTKKKPKRKKHATPQAKALDAAFQRGHVLAGRVSLRMKALCGAPENKAQ